MKESCFDCHRATKKVKGKVNLAELSVHGDFLKNLKLSRTAARAMGKAEMPPATGHNHCLPVRGMAVAWLGSLTEHLQDALSSV